MWKSLNKLPNSRLGEMYFHRKKKKIDEIIQLCDDYNEITNELYFDRNSHSFGSILNFYRTGKLHLIDNICVLSFHEDLEYWRIDECILETCCQIKYQQKKDNIFEEIQKEEEAEKEKEKQTTLTENTYDEDQNCCCLSDFIINSKFVLFSHSFEDSSTSIGVDVVVIGDCIFFKDGLE